jgi:hypothetical protein
MAMELTRAEEHIKTYSNWIIKAFESENLLLDYSMESLRLLDKFIDDNTINGKATLHGILSKNAGEILYGMGIYLGETIKRQLNGCTWQIEEGEEELNTFLLLPGGTEIYPLQKVTKRFLYGAEDGIYGYGMIAVKELSKNDYWEKNKKNATANKTKPWWKIW